MRNRKKRVDLEEIRKIFSDPDSLEKTKELWRGKFTY